MSSSPQVVVDFLVSLAKSSKSKSSALMAKAAISHCHLLECPIGGDPTKHVAVTKALNSIVKKYSKPVKKAPTLSSLEVSLIVEKLLEEHSTKNFRTAVMFLLQFNLMARYSDIMFLKVKELEFLDSGDLKVTVSRAKNFESFNAKSSFVAANPGGKINSVDLLKKFLVLRKGSPEDFVFASFREVQGRVFWLDKHVKEDVARKYLKMALASAGVVEPSQYTLHSLKTGSVSEARNSGLASVAEINHHTRWSLSKMVDRLP